MGEQVLTKRDAYDRAARGEFGNIVPRWFTHESWWGRRTLTHLPLWGIQTMRVPGGPAKLDVPTDEVEAVFRSEPFRANRPVISPMVHCVGNVTLLGDVWDSPTGLEVNGVEYPPSSQWRALMLHPTRWVGTAARLLLARHLNANSLDDLRAVFERFPGAVCELSALDVCFGTCPGRNAVVWEVRHY